MASTRLLVDILALRAAGWRLPRFRLCMLHPRRGVLTLHEEWMPAWHRHVRVARLLDPATGADANGVPPLFDPALLHMTADEWVLSGIESTSDGERTIDVAQTWRVTPVELVVGSE